MKEHKHTPGPWRIDERSGIIVIYAGQKNEDPCILGIPDSRRIIVFNGRYIEDECHWEMTGEQIANAALIVAAVNACFELNPENPMAVAEALPELVEALETIHARTEEYTTAPDKERAFESIEEISRAALAKLEAKP